jgi:hypothetical protein
MDPKRFNFGFSQDHYGPCNRFANADVRLLPLEAELVLLEEVLLADSAIDESPRKTANQAD